MSTLADLQQEFYATQLGLAQPWPSINDLRYAYFLGVKNGDILLNTDLNVPALIAEQAVTDSSAYIHVNASPLLSAGSRVELPNAGTVTADDIRAALITLGLCKATVA